MNEKDYPALYTAADSASIRCQTRFTNFIKSYLLVLVATGLFGINGAESGFSATVVAILIMISLILSVLLNISKDTGNWYRSRALAESIKTSTWKYMMRSEPFVGPEVSSTVDAQFTKLIKALLAEHNDLSGEFSAVDSSIDQITSKMREVRNLPLADRKEIYLNKRIREQQEWYRLRSEQNRKAGSKWFALFIVAQTIAAVIAIIRINFPEYANWPVELFMMAAGAVLTWIQVKKYRELSAAYSLTAHELGVIKAELDQIFGDVEFSQFISDSESAVSREHTQWLARKDYS